MLDTDVVKSVKANKDSNTLSDVPVLVTDIDKRQSPFAINDDGNVYLSQNIYSTGDMIATDNELYTGGPKLSKVVTDLNKAKVGDTNIAFDAKTFNSAKMAEMSMKVTNFAASSYKGDAPASQTKILAEYMKGIMNQLYIMNIQNYVNNSKNNEMADINGQLTLESLHNIEDTLTMMQMQNRYSQEKDAMTSSISGN
jgi:hypothetical protein